MPDDRPDKEEKASSSDRTKMHETPASKTIVPPSRKSKRSRNTVDYYLLENPHLSARRRTNEIPSGPDQAFAADRTLSESSFRTDQAPARAVTKQSGRSSRQKPRSPTSAIPNAALELPNVILKQSGLGRRVAVGARWPKKRTSTAVALMVRPEVNGSMLTTAATDCVQRLSGSVSGLRSSLQDLKVNFSAHWACAGLEEDVDMLDEDWICPDCTAVLSRGE